MATKKPAMPPFMHTKKTEKKETMKMEKKEGPGMEKRERKMGMDKMMPKFKAGGAVKKGGC